MGYQPMMQQTQINPQQYIELLKNGYIVDNATGQIVPNPPVAAQLLNQILQSNMRVNQPPQMPAMGQMQPMPMADMRQYPQPMMPNRTFMGQNPAIMNTPVQMTQNNIQTQQESAARWGNAPSVEQRAYPSATAAVIEQQVQNAVQTQSSGIKSFDGKDDKIMSILPEANIQRAIVEDHELNIDYTDYNADFTSIEDASYNVCLTYREDLEKTLEEGTKKAPMSTANIHVVKRYMEKANLSIFDDVTNVGEFLASVKPFVKQQNNDIVTAYLYDFSVYLTQYVNEFLYILLDGKVSIDNILTDYNDLQVYIKDKNFIAAKKLDSNLLEIIRANKQSADKSVNFVTIASMSYIHYSRFEFGLDSISKEAPELILQTKENHSLLNVVTTIFEALQYCQEEFKRQTRHFMVTKDNTIYQIYMLDNKFFIKAM